MKLTDSQREAVELGLGNMQMIACAGSGKTEVVAQRVAHLLNPDNPQSLIPENIVAFTFTEKAAAELRERIIARTKETLGEVTGMAEMFVGTIHAFCLDLLKTENPEFLKYEVLNEVQQKLFIDRYSNKSGLTISTDLKNKVLRRYIDTDHYANALSILLEDNLDLSFLTDCSISLGLDCYRSILREKCFLDYSSILAEAFAMLKEDKSVGNRLRKRIRYLIVDEYQDVNPIQESIVRILHKIGANVCVVGDDDQTIYQWRGSDVQNIMNFEDRYPEVTKIYLEDNFRSSEGVIDVAQSFIEKNPERLMKSMSPKSTQIYETGDIVALQFETPKAEAEHIATSIKSLYGVAFEEGGHSRGLSWSDMAVLLRSVKNNGEPVCTALKEAGIPFVVNGMNKLFDTPHAEAARQLFYFMVGRADRDALVKAWRCTDFDLNQSDLERAIDNAENAQRAIDNPHEKRNEKYSIQQVFRDFIDDAGVLEDLIPNERGEIAFSNLGKFSQVISDFETIHFHSDPAEKYKEFANFLYYRADSAYPEGWQDNQYANLDAVKIMTIHQAKGMEWPAVFVPSLLRNRFPSAKATGKNVWHLLPADGIKNQSRYLNSKEDERRLFYVAITRSRKFLHMSWAPISGKNNRYRFPSEFWENVLVSKFVKRHKPDYSNRERLTPMSRHGMSNVTFSFSDIKYYFECPYQFKLRVLYGFNSPIDKALGYGKSLHDALAEVHQRAIRGDVVSQEEVPKLVATHLHVPYAFPQLRRALTASAERVLFQYIDNKRNEFKYIEFSEKQVEINLDGGIRVIGRIDLVKRIDTNETTIVDLKSSERAQAEDITDVQLHTYALGYKELTGENADYVEIYELDEGKGKPRAVDQYFIDTVQERVKEAATNLQIGSLKPNPVLNTCQSCDFKGMCSSAKIA